MPNDTGRRADHSPDDGLGRMSRSRLPLVIVGLIVGAALAAGAIWLTGSDGGDHCEPAPFTSEHSVAYLWNEALLDAIRRDLPAPTVHARNLFHMSAAMWDAWAAFDEAATGTFVKEKHSASDVTAARAEAISYAAYRLLEARYIDSFGASDSIPQFDALMAALCYPIDFVAAEGDEPAAIGNRIATTILEESYDDGANELGGYAADYIAVNQPLIVANSGTAMSDPNRWQPLQIGEMISQNGIAVVNGTQEFIDPHWGFVNSFALPPPGATGVPIDPGAPPHLGDPATDQQFKDAALEVVRYSSLLDPAAGVMIDISPATLGDNSLGANDGSGLPMNPITNEPYQPNLVNQADFGRAVAEFWADGPSSETPPGHWNTLANAVSDELDPELRIGGRGEVVDRLEWDVKLYLALNAANHDGAIAAWGTKGFYDYSRPISMIRYMGGIGQSSDPALPSYHERGIPLERGLVELITAESSAPGARHAHLADYVDEVAVWAWTGTPEDPETETAGVAWIRAVDWVPYQLPTFVTPSFAAYVSGHSVFSRAAAEIMTGFTGSEFFPGGLGEWTIEADSFEFEAGPPTDIVLQWARYRDASDQAGLSRLYGGIHVRADDFAGRVMGAEIGKLAWAEAQRYYGDDIN